uniref:Putative secreted protein n=1 Tax=Ixodes ricinus TaxID=34613 RepID=A0A6B0UJQ7_IXORI
MQFIHYASLLKQVSGCTLLFAGGMRYLSPTPGPERTPAGVIRDAQLAVELNTDINGLKGPSPLTNLMGFNIVWGFTVDYMYCVLHGVSKQITEFLVNSSHSRASFYIDQLL